MVQGNSTKKDVYDVATKTIHIGKIAIPPGKYRGNLKKENGRRTENLKIQSKP